jgi:hypothetical protein
MYCTRDGPDLETAFCPVTLAVTTLYQRLPGLAVFGVRAVNV